MVTQDYFRYIPGVVGFLAPFVASASSLLASERKGLKWALVIVGLLLGVVSFGSNAYFERTQSAEKQQTQNQLSIFIEEGDKLLGYIYSSPQPFDEKPVREWNGRVEAYVDEKLGPIYVRRLRSQAMITSGTPMGIYVDRIGYYNSVRMRNAHLQIFISELR
jgi:hypothetical protein